MALIYVSASNVDEIVNKEKGTTKDGGTFRCIRSTSEESWREAFAGLMLALSGITKAVGDKDIYLEIGEIQSVAGIRKRLFSASMYVAVANCHDLDPILREIGIKSEAEITPTVTSSVNQPVENQPVENQPVENQPVESQPVENQPVENQPVENQPVEPESFEDYYSIKMELTKDAEQLTQPVETQPVETQPVETQPVESQPVKASIPELSEGLQTFVDMLKETDPAVYMTLMNTLYKKMSK